MLVSMFVLLISSPIFILIYFLLYFQNGGSPLFFQSRPGKNKKIFRIVKFKTMNDKRGGDGKLLPDNERITKMGQFIRKTSIDELPQLINVLKGDMSLIGPRPLLIEYLPLYNDFQNQRHDVKPGITGWAQVNGRNTISWKQKFEFDVWYVKNFSFLLDIRIIFLTIEKVFKREGINSSDVVTMDFFKGNDE